MHCNWCVSLDIALIFDLAFDQLFFIGNVHVQTNMHRIRRTLLFILLHFAR